MRVSVCIYCGEPISEKGNRFSRSPNLCASCSSIADGLSELITAKEFDLVQAYDVAVKRLEVREAA